MANNTVLLNSTNSTTASTTVTPSSTTVATTSSATLTTDLTTADLPITTTNSTVTKNEGMTSAEEIAIGVSVSVVVALAILGFVCFIRRKRRAKDRASYKEEHGHIYYNDPPQSPTGSVDGTEPAENADEDDEDYCYPNNGIPGSPLNNSDTGTQQPGSPIYVNHESKPRAKKALLPPNHNPLAVANSPPSQNQISASGNATRSPNTKKKPLKPKQMTSNVSKKAEKRNRTRKGPAKTASPSKPEKSVDTSSSIPGQEEYVEILPDAPTTIAERKKILMKGLSPKAKTPIPKTIQVPNTSYEVPKPKTQHAHKPKPNQLQTQHSYLEVLPDSPAASDEMYSYAETNFAGVNGAISEKHKLGTGKGQLNAPSANGQDNEYSTNYYNMPVGSSYQNVGTRK